MSFNIPCPRCRQPLEIPKPAPEKLRCPKCGTVIKNSAGRSVQAAPPAPVSNAAPVVHAAHAVQAPVAHRNGSLGKGVAVPASAVPVPAAALPVAGSAIPVAQAIVAGRPGIPVAVLAPPVGKQAIAEPRVAQQLAHPGAFSKGKSARKIIVLAGAGALLMFLLGSVTAVVWNLASDSGDEVPEIKAKKAREARKRIMHPKVKQAVDKGVAFLRKNVPNELGGQRAGAIALMGLTLLECGAEPEDPDVVKLAKIVRDNVPQMNMTYDVSPAIFFLDRLHKGRTVPDDDRKRIQTLALRLIKGQNNPQNLWGYAVPILDEKEEESVLKQLRDKKDIQRAGGGFDLSNTQFAALALWIARKYDVPVDAALRAAADTMRKNQNPKGHWAYQLQGDQFMDTGACVGLIVLALGQAASDDEKEKSADFLRDPAVVKAVDHLGNFISKNAQIEVKSKEKRPAINATAGGDLYFLWTLERTALILNLKSMGDQDWHYWGSDYLIDHQRDDGSWVDARLAFGPVDTCFALLFLMQANLFQDLTDKLHLAMTAPSPILTATHELPYLPAKKDS